MASMTSLLRLLAAAQPPAEPIRSAMSRQALAAALQLQCQIDDAVSLSRLESGQLGGARASVATHDLLASVIDDLRPVSEALQVDLALGPAPAEDAVFADPWLLRRLLESLAHQCLRYAQLGHAVRLSWSQASPGSRAIRWEGFAPGRTPDSLACAFDPLGGRGESAVGLGLRLARDGLRAMDGELRLVPDRHGEGTDLELVLPDAATLPSATRGRGRVEAVTMSERPRTRLLLVEDDPVSRGIVTQYLKARPQVELQLAFDGQEALAKVREWQPAVLVSDLRLPDMSGEMLVRRLADEHAQWRRSAHCVAFSADLPPLPQDLFDDAWRKPLSSARFLESIDRILQAVSDPSDSRPLQCV